VVVTLKKKKTENPFGVKGGRSIKMVVVAVLAAASILPCVWLLCRFWCGADLKAREKKLG